MKDFHGKTIVTKKFNTDRLLTTTLLSFLNFSCTNIAPVAGPSRTFRKSTHLFHRALSLVTPWRTTQ